ncbi:ribonuclease activity regulator RraA [Mesorhizobium sp.]|uniref:ribonuclease activity regulator RraA n=1 Tax=Mesorhizobium sp. TaxID=1871066 RepID=UPI000FE7CB04|nr:ribonuclease activity regulator RraA [Mesorhizobium sp.]RWI87937.1 MAG: ribonuclease activity regulator RraA [Mesorhizobium sp.]
MPQYILSEGTRSKLRHSSVATISTLLFKRGLRNQVIQDVHPLSHRDRNMVGQAYTLRCIPAREDLNQLSVFQDPLHPQRHAIENAPEGCVLVIDSRKNPRAASAGSILVSRLMMRGAEGIVTDGGLRDSPDIASLNIGAYHNRPSAPTNLTLHQAVEIDVPIGCGDVAVWPGDIVVGDREAVIIIPSQLADEIAEEAKEMTLFEDFVAEKVLEGQSIIGLYPPSNANTVESFKKWRACRRKL